MKNNFDVNNVFTYHAPHGTQQARYVELREKAREFAALIQADCPQAAETTLALRAVQQASMWANASIAINESDSSDPVGTASV